MTDKAYHGVPVELYWPTWCLIVDGLGKCRVTCGHLQGVVSGFECVAYLLCL